MKLFKGLLALVVVMTLGMAFAQFDADVNDDERATAAGAIAGESATTDKMDITIISECTRLIDAYIDGDGTYTLPASDLQNAGTAWWSGSNRQITIKYDYTTNCDSTGLVGTQKITMIVADLPSGLKADLNNITAGHDIGGITGAEVGAPANNILNATGSSGTAHTLLSGIKNVTVAGTNPNKGTVDLDIYGFAAATTGTDVTLTFTLSD